MTVAAARRRGPKGVTDPRLAPPLPARHLGRELIAAAKAGGIDLLPWQKVAARYLMARGSDGRWLYREVAVVVARQNGKTALLVPRILWALQAGRRVVHTAQNRELPREVFMEVADRVDLGLLKRRPRFANGQERIDAVTGGSYKIIAPQRGVRGLAADDLIVDEIREFTDYDFISAAGPILTARPDPQTIYLSNAGDDDSVVLNDLRDAVIVQNLPAAETIRLGYLEWSAAPELDADDERGWAQANPAMGYLPGVYETLQHDYATKPAEYFETEHLCRWVRSMAKPLVRPEDWAACQTGELEAPLRPAMGLALDPDGRRASAVLAWSQADGTVAVHPIIDVSSEVAVDVEHLGRDLRRQSIKRRARTIGYSGASDLALARYLPSAKAIDGRTYANASAQFAELAAAGQLRWVSGDAIGEDLHHVVRKPQSDGTSVAVRSGEHSATAALAAIRAVWLASAPRAVPRIG